MKRWVVGIDEAGRGALAGPVAVGLCAVREGEDVDWLKDVKDSKQLTPKQRQAWFNTLKRHSRKSEVVRYKVVQISNTLIDSEGMSKCLVRAIDELLAPFTPSAVILLDGRLKAPKRFKNQTTIIRGDETEPLISMASIAAKVTRDAHMTRLNKKYPYEFDIHKGYGTLEHRNLIKKRGPCPAHRLTYIKINQIWKNA